MPAAILDLLESAQEFLVAEPLALPLLLAPSEPLPKFSSCFLLPLETFHSAPSFSSYIGPASSDSHCATVFVTSPYPSHASVGVSWTFPTSEGEVVLSANRTVASYAPLIPHSPISGETVVAEGSSRELAWQGGPIPWPLLPSSHYREIEIADTNMVTLEPLPHSSLHRYKLTCLGRGNTMVAAFIKECKLISYWITKGDPESGQQSLDNIAPPSVHQLHHHGILCNSPFH